MEKIEKDSEIAGEKGLSQLITWSPNYEWKLIKIAFLKDIRKNPTNILRFGGTFSEEDKLILEQQINIEIIAEAVSFAELLGAYLLAFSGKEKVIQKVLFQYQVKQVTEQYKKIQDMDCQAISRLIGYPDSSEFVPDCKEKFKDDFDKSAENIKKVLCRIAKFYLDNLQFYNDYKHGFRIFPTTSSPPNSKTFGATFQILKGKELNKATIYESSHLKNKAEEAFEIANKITNILSILLPIFRERIIEDKKEFQIVLFNDVEEGKNNFKNKELK